MDWANDSLGQLDYSIEQAAADNCGRPVAGVDEAGRGPWAGPVIAAAVILDPECLPEGLNDSKKLSANARAQSFDAIMASAYVGVGGAEVGEIDRINILHATMAAMRRAVDALTITPAIALIDGNRCPDLACRAEALVKGDGRALTIAAASIIAKVTRDRIMAKLALDHPGYGWERNKGYGAPEHRAGLAVNGVTTQHRRSFRPIRLALSE